MQPNSHIACPICSKQCRGRLIKHLVEHGYNDEKSFLLDYPNSPLETDAWKLAKKKMSEKAKLRMLDPKEREKISIGTKMAMAVPEVRERFRKIVCKPLSDDTKKKMSISISKSLSNPDVKKKMYTADRNKKISEKKKEYWKKIPTQKLGWVKFGNLCVTKTQ